MVYFLSEGWGPDFRAIAWCTRCKEVKCDANDCPRVGDACMVVGMPWVFEVCDDGARDVMGYWIHSKHWFLKGGAASPWRAVVREVSEYRNFTSQQIFC